MYSTNEMDIAGGSLGHRPQLRDDVVEMMCKELLSGLRGIIRAHMGGGRGLPKAGTCEA